MNEKTPPERFSRCLHLLEKGYICFEDEARKLADSDKAAERVEDALYSGAKILYRDYLQMISEGQVDYKETAELLASRFNFRLRSLDFAVKEGIRMSQRPTLVR